MMKVKPLLSRLLGEPFLRRLQWPVLIGFMELHAGALVLDIGAGRMRHAVRLARLGARVSAVDLAFRGGDEAWARARGVVPVRCDATDLPFPDAHFDRVLMSSLMHMVPDPQKLLAEIRRVLKPEGFVVLSVPNHYHYAPRLMRAGWMRRLLRLPETPQALAALLNERFGVGGPQGYYRRADIICLVEGAGFRVIDHRNSPGRVGTFLWEMSVVAFVRFGTIALHALLPLTPLAALGDVLTGRADCGEHILKIGRDHAH